MKCVSNGSHEVVNQDSTVVAVGVSGKSTAALGSTFGEGVRDHAVASLESDLGLEGVRVDCTNLLEGDVGAIEQTCVIRRSALITCNVVVLISNVSRIRINVDLDATVQGANQGGGVVIGDKTVVTSQSRSCLLYTSPSPRDATLSRMPSSA